MLPTGKVGAGSTNQGLLVVVLIGGLNSPASVKPQRSCRLLKPRCCHLPLLFSTITEMDSDPKPYSYYKRTTAYLGPLGYRISTYISVTYK